MQLSPEQQKAIEEQKEQCIFCQIVAGNIPAKKVYEDKLTVGILDIHPASKGHVLFMPKEHYPIMPIIPPETFKHLIDKAKEIDKCVKEALLCNETTIFIANGQPAGQQSSHFMMHIIPREGGGLEMLDIGEKNCPDSEIKEVLEKVGAHLKQILERNLPALGYGKMQAAPRQKPNKEELIRMIKANPQLGELIKKNPEQFKKMIPQQPQLKELFSGFDINQIISEIIGNKTAKKMSVDDLLR
jgi:histidine triad (HIT) family protein